MKRTFIYDRERGCMVEIDRREYELAFGSPMIVGDLPAYESPIDGRVIDGRAARREDLKRNGCVPYEPSLRGQVERELEVSNRKLEANVGRTIDKLFHEATPRQRELIVQALQAGLTPEIVRR